jgi:meiotically up-regulated gene 157 (Mug157) protein
VSRFFAPDQKVLHPLQAGDVFSFVHGPNIRNVYAFERDEIGRDTLIVDAQSRFAGPLSVFYERAAKRA